MNSWSSLILRASSNMYDTIMKPTPQQIEEHMGPIKQKFMQMDSIQPHTQITTIAMPTWRIRHSSNSENTSPFLTVAIIPMKLIKEKPYGWVVSFCGPFSWASIENLISICRYPSARFQFCKYVPDFTYARAALVLLFFYCFFWYTIPAFWMTEHQRR